MALIHVNLYDYLSNENDSVLFYKITFRNFSDTVVSSASVTSGKPNYGTLNEKFTTNATLTFHTPTIFRNFTDNFTIRDIINPNFKITANFRPHYSFPLSANFYGAGENEILIKAFFGKSLYTPIQAIFTNNLNCNFLILANLGLSRKDFNIQANFQTASQRNFNANIIISPNSNGNIANFINYQEFLSFITIKGNNVSNKEITANFRVPPFDFDFAIQARFAGSNIIFVQNVNTGMSYQAQVNEDGFWFVNGLLPGNYIVTPKLSGITFNPTQMDVTITNYSPMVYFTELGVSDINNPFGDSIEEPIQDEINIINNPNLPNTYDIQGFILPDDGINYKQILTVINDDILATNFKQTLINYPTEL